MPNVAAALSYAERRIGELQNESRYDRPGIMMVVKDEARQAVLFLPFLAGWSNFIQRTFICVGP